MSETVYAHEFYLDLVNRSLDEMVDERVTDVFIYNPNDPDDDNYRGEYFSDAVSRLLNNTMESGFEFHGTPDDCIACLEDHGFVYAGTFA